MTPYFSFPPACKALTKRIWRFRIEVKVCGMNVNIELDGRMKEQWGWRWIHYWKHFRPTLKSVYVWWIIVSPSWWLKEFYRRLVSNRSWIGFRAWAIFKTLLISSGSGQESSFFSRIEPAYYDMLLNPRLQHEELTSSSSSILSKRTAETHCFLV